MHLLFVLNEIPYPAHRNGVALISCEILRRAPAGARIDLVVATAPEPQAEAALRALAPAIADIHYLDCAAALPRYRIGNLLSGALAGRNLFVPRGLRQLLRRQAWDAVYVAPLMNFADLRQSTPTVLNAVDSFARFNDVAFRRGGHWRDRVKRMLYLAYERRVLRSPSAVNFVSSTDLDYVRRHGTDSRLHCIANGVDTTYFAPDDTPREDASLLFTGNFAYRPNAEAALHFAHHVLPSIRRQRPDAVFVVAGREPPDELRGIDGVVVTGFLPDIRSAYRRAAIFVCPLQSGAGIKNKILEAMACELPIVTTSLGVDGMPGMQAGRDHVLAEDDAAFAAEVLRLLESPERGRQIGRAARQLASTRMSWDSVAAQYFNLLAAAATARANALQGVPQ